MDNRTIVKAFTKYDSVPGEVYATEPEPIPAMSGDTITIPPSGFTVHKYTAFKVEGGSEGVRFVHYVETFLTDGELATIYARYTGTEMTGLK